MSIHKQFSIYSDGSGPEHAWSGTHVRFKNPDGSWGPFVNVIGATGDKGNTGATGATGDKGPTTYVNCSTCLTCNTCASSTCGDS